MVCTHTKNLGEIAIGVAPKDAKTCFVFLFVTNTTWTFGTYLALILTTFEIKDVNRCAHA